MTRLRETQNATIAIQAKQLAELGELLKKRKKAKKGKRVTAEVLRIAREEDDSDKKRWGPHKKINEEEEVYRSPVTRRRCTVLSHVRV
jgi:hypothetical protein